MANYCSEADIEKRLGMTIDANSRPTTTDLAGLLDDADDMINQELKETSNQTDTYGKYKQIAINLILKMINNMYSFTNPEQFPYVEVELTEAEIRMLHKDANYIAGESFEIGQ